MKHLPLSAVVASGLWLSFALAGCSGNGGTGGSGGTGTGSTTSTTSSSSSSTSTSTSTSSGGTGGATGTGGGGGSATSTTSSSSSSSGGGSGGSGGGNAANGKTLVLQNSCAGCHQQAGSADVLSGSTTPVESSVSTYGSNLTPDMATGLGSWTAAEIKTAVGTGVGKNGAPLCMQMIPFHNFSSSDLDDVVAYLQSLPAVSHAIPTSTCK